MQRIKAILSFFILLGLCYYSFSSLMPKGTVSETIPYPEFSVQRALVDLKEISKNPHYVGSKDHQRVQDYIINQLENLGLEVEIQEGFSLNPKWKSFGKQQNILAKIKGSESEKSLVLLTHYDSAPASSYGASDAGSGVVTILESVRAYLSENKTPKNDIIILITDGEELGLNGAKLFVNKHPWAKNIGLVLNFEARGSGGPSNMIVETNGGNHNLIKGFVEANPDYPVASSLMYSIYKMLPNDTDSTVFREDGDIDSFFFAFIDDHYDYHTANDTYENLDRNTLAHQGSYLLPLLHYFADAGLSSLKAETDDVYVNFPFIKMIQYPFSWIVPMLIIAILIIIALVFFGIKKRKLHAKDISKGFLAFLVAVVLSGGIGFLGWKALLYIYPQYHEIQHGFTYNGHTYIAFFVFLSLAITLKCYQRLAKNSSVSGLFVAPLLFWIIINTVVAIYLKGAAYFIIPVFFGLLSLWVLIRQEKPSLILMALLTAPAIFLFAPLVQFFPVGLGLKFLVASSILTVLLVGLALPIFGFYKRKGLLSTLFFILAFGLFIKAHLNSSFTPEKQKPNSLVFYQDADTGQSVWTTYDTELDSWTQGYLGDAPEDASLYTKYASGSKYNRGYTFATKVPSKDLPAFKTTLLQDTIINGNRNVSFTIFPQRNVNQITLYSEGDYNFTSLSFNGESLPIKEKEALHFMKSKALLRYYVSGKDSLVVRYSVKKEEDSVRFTVMEYSFDLLEHPQFSITKRPENMMPKPYVVTDAIVIKKIIDIEDLQRERKDTLVVD